MTRLNVAFLDLGRGFESHARALDAAVRDVAASGQYILGPRVREFEAAVADYLGVRHAVGCASGTDALQLAVLAAGIGPGDEVVTTPFTFAATLEAIEYAGATPVLVDIHPETFNIDPERIAEAITPRTRAILPVHLFGLPADMDAIMSLGEEHGLAVIEDAAQSLGARWQDRPTGGIGHFGALSFYPSKTLGCFGDGGLVACHDDEMHRRLLELRNHGFDADGEHVRLGYNSRLDEIQAAVLQVKLPLLDESIARRREIAAHYDEALSHVDARLQPDPEGSRHARGYYTLCVNDRDALRKALHASGVATALYYGRPLHRHRHYSGTCRFDKLPVAEHVASRCLSLPVYPEMTDAEVEYVAAKTAAALG